MHPVALEIFSLKIRWYGIFVALGVAAAYFLMQKNRKYADASSEQVADVCFIVVLAGVLGARLFYVIQFFKHFQYELFNGVMIKRSIPQMLLEMIRIDKGGLVFYGGFICAVITLMIYCRRKKLRFLKIGDMVAPALALGHAFGRIGCLLNACCYGMESSWGISYPANKDFGFCAGKTVQPVQLYEAIANIILMFLLCLGLRKLKPGQTAALYFFLYGILRFSLEFLRGDHKDFILGFTPAQTIGLVLIPIGLLAFIILGKKQKEEKDEPEDKTENDGE